jgi:hypothetical protein
MVLDRLGVRMLVQVLDRSICFLVLASLEDFVALGVCEPALHEELPDRRSQPGQHLQPQPHVREGENCAEDPQGE